MWWARPRTRTPRSGVRCHAPSIDVARDARRSRGRTRRAGTGRRRRTGTTTVVGSRRHGDPGYAPNARSARDLVDDGTVLRASTRWVTPTGSGDTRSRRRWRRRLHARAASATTERGARAVAPGPRARRPSVSRARCVRRHRSGRTRSSGAWTEDADELHCEAPGARGAAARRGRATTVSSWARRCSTTWSTATIAMR